MTLDKLIHSLDTQEITHFRKYAFEQRKGKEHKKILKLFNLLLEKPDFADSQISKQINPNEPVSKIRFIKFALKERLINSVLDFQKKNDQSAIIFDLIQKADLLKERIGLSEAFKLADKAYNKALLTEKTELAILAAKTKKRIMQLQQVWKKNAHEPIEELDQSIYKLLNRVQKTEMFLSRDQQLINLKHIYGWELPSKEVNAELDLIINSETFKEEPAKEDFEAFCLYHLCHSRYYGAKNLLKKKLFHEKIVVEFMQQDKQKLYYFLNTFRTVLNNYLNTCIDLKIFDDFDFYINQLENTTSGLNPRNKARLFLIVSNLQFNRVLESKNFKTGEELVNIYLAQAKEHYSSIALEFFHSFHINAAIISFLNLNYKRCLKLLNQVFSKNSKLPGYDLVRITQLLNLLSHLVLENFSNVDSAIRNMERSESKLLATERIILDFALANNRKTLSLVEWKSVFFDINNSAVTPEDLQLQSLIHLPYFLTEMITIHESNPS